MSEQEVTVTLRESEARALLPQVGRDQDADQWNRRMDSAEDGQRKIRAALREVSTEPAKGQEALL
jgi:hypothetical protein